MGFSLGATQALALGADDPARFSRLVLVEGGLDAWRNGRLSVFANGGGRRVLYGCGQKGNEGTARLATAKLGALPFDARVVFAPVGHSFDVPLQQAIHGELDWFAEGDTRWARPE